MIIIGLNCGFSLKKEFLPEVPNDFCHDASAVLIKDGKIIAAVEEERLNRLKHTNKFCIKAIKYCLKQAKITIDKVHKIAFYFTEEFMDDDLGVQYIEHSTAPWKLAREMFSEIISKSFNISFNPQKIVFVKHHLAHAYSAYLHSGFDNALIAIIDGQGEKESFSIYEGKKDRINLLHEISNKNSLGYFYLKCTQLLGYDLFDEYKVMGLAPYGDSTKYDFLMEKIYRLLPKGNYEIDLNKLQTTFLQHGFVARRKGEFFNLEHKNLAAAAQRTLEKVVLHIIRYWQEKLQAKNLCLAGGVAQNCSMNGSLAYSGLFEKIFVHPASHDSGAALGAAMWVLCNEQKKYRRNRISHVYYGPHMGDQKEIKAKLESYSHLLNYIKYKNICGETAKLLADGAVIGWVQGRLEFGPRALGNRSILADPRPEENKDRINKLVKKREGYRPFAPSILKEKVNEYFVLPKTELNLDFMNFNLKIKKGKQSILGAVTHVNGTGRVQTIDKSQNLKYWTLIKNFGDITGVPILLNTSFNNRYEPIVCYLDDSINCFLTTGLDFLVVGDYLIDKKSSIADSILDLKFSLTNQTLMKKITDDCSQEYKICFSHNKQIKAKISKETYRFLLYNELPPYLYLKKLRGELFDLWSRRFICLSKRKKL